MTTNSSEAPVGRRVQLIASDSGDFVAVDGSVRFDATVIRAATYGQADFGPVREFLLLPDTGTRFEEFDRLIRLL